MRRSRPSQIFDLVVGLDARGAQVLFARGPDHAVAPIRAEDPERSPAPLRSVDEKVGQRGLRRRRILRRNEVEQPALELLDTLAGRTRQREDLHYPLVAQPKAGRQRKKIDL